MSRGLLALVLPALLALSCGTNFDDGPTDEELEQRSASLQLGGQLWDDLFRASGAAEQTETFVPYTQTAGTFTGSATWRCRECHGWDYRGVEGAYASGIHFTGVPGVIQTVGTRDSIDVEAIIGSGTAPVDEEGNPTSGVPVEHAFESILSESAIEHLTRLMVEGLVDTTAFIDPVTGRVDGDATRGEELYGAADDSSCARCHGTIGHRIDFDPGDGFEPLGTRVRSDPWQSFHRLRWGVPGSTMPSAVVDGLGLDDQRALMAFIQDLPD